MGGLLCNVGIGLIESHIENFNNAYENTYDKNISDNNSNGVDWLVEEGVVESVPALENEGKNKNNILSKEQVIKNKEVNEYDILDEMLSGVEDWDDEIEEDWGSELEEEDVVDEIEEDVSGGLEIEKDIKQRGNISEEGRIEDNISVSVDREPSSVNRGSVSVDREPSSVNRGSVSVDREPSSVNSEPSSVNRDSVSVDVSNVRVDTDTNYNEMGIEELWENVKIYMINNGVRVKPIKNTDLEAKYGSKNVFKLVRGGYLLIIRDGYTMGI